MRSILPELVGASAARHMVPCEASYGAGLASISGFVSALRDSHGSKAKQLLYVNKRCCACNVASNLINDLHEQLWAYQQRTLRHSSFRAAVSGVRCFPAFVLFLTKASSQSATGADGAPDDRADICRLLRTAVLSAWKADVPDGFLRSTAAEPQDGDKHESGAARRAGHQLKHTREALPQGLPSNGTADAAGRRSTAVIKALASAPASGERCRQAARSRQTVSSEKRMAWHSAPSPCSGPKATAADESVDAAASLRPTTQGLAESAQDTSSRRAASPAAADLLQETGRSWAATARLCRSPAQQPKLSHTYLHQVAAALQCSQPATCPQFAGRPQTGRAKGQQVRGLLEEILNEGSATERLLQPAARASVAEDRQHFMETELEAGPGAAEIVRSARHAPAGPAAAKKRGRRASWPAMPPPKRRAIHKNLPASMRTAAPAHVASSPMISISPVTLDEQRKHAQPAAVCQRAVTNDGTDTSSKHSRPIHDMHGWRHRKQCQPEPLPELKTASPHSHHSGQQPPLAEPIENEHQAPAVPRPFDALLATWQNPCIGRNAAEQYVLQLSDLAPSLAYLAVPQAVDRTDFMRACVLQQVRTASMCSHGTASSQ